MASTLTPSTFQVKIKEDHVINGIRTVNENLLRIPNVTNYDRRIVTVPVNTNVDLINTNGPTPGPALFPSSSIAYGRITNMDDSSRLAVTFTSSPMISFSFSNVMPPAWPTPAPFVSKLIHRFR